MKTITLSADPDYTATGPCVDGGILLDFASWDITTLRLTKQDLMDLLELFDSQQDNS